MSSGSTTKQAPAAEASTNTAATSTGGASILEKTILETVGKSIHFDDETTEHAQRRRECIIQSEIAGAKGGGLISGTLAAGHFLAKYFYAPYNRISWRPKLLLWSSVSIAAFYIYAENALNACVRKNNLALLHRNMERKGIPTTTQDNTKQTSSSSS